MEAATENRSRGPDASGGDLNSWESFFVQVRISLGFLIPVLRM
jgi:hypothetical protein